MTKRRTVLHYGAAALSSTIIGATALNPLRSSTEEADSEPGTKRRSGTTTSTGTTETETTTEAPTPERWSVYVGSDLSLRPLGVDTGVLYGDDDTLSLLGASDGEEQWQYTTDDSIKGGISISNGHAFGASEAGDIFGVDLATGKQLWETEVDVQRIEDVAVHDGTSVFVGGYYLHQLRLEDGSVERQWDLGGNHHVRASMSIDETNIYLPVSDSTLTAVALDSGSRNWEFSTGEVATTSSQMTGVLATGSRVFTGSEGGGVYALSPANGEQIWSDDLGGKVFVNALSDNHLLVRSIDLQQEETTLFSLDPATGDEQWQFEQDEHHLSLPWLLDGYIYIADNSGKIYRINRDSGEIDQSYQAEPGYNTLTTGSDYLYYFDGSSIHSITKTLQS